MSNLTRGQKILAHIKVLQKFIQEPEVIELCNSDNEKYNELLIEKFSQLKNNNEQLFKIASSHVLNEEEYNILHMMLSKIDKIVNNIELIFSDIPFVGQNLYNQYVKPHIDEEKEKNGK